MFSTDAAVSETLSIFLTGGTGYLGSALLGELLRRGHRVTALARAGSVHRLPRHPRLRVAAGDLTDESLNLGTVAGAGFDAIVHCAALPKLAGASQRTMERAHIGPARMLAGYAERIGTPRFFHISTAFVGADASGLLAESAAQVQTCDNAYERTKTMAEHALCEPPAAGLEIFRPGIILPEWMSSRATLRASPLGPIFRALDASGRGTCRLAANPSVAPGFCRRADIVQFLAGRLEAAPREGAFWNLVSPRTPTVEEIASAFSRAGLCLGFRFADRPESAAFRPWASYLSRDRRWEQTQTLAEANRIGVALKDISGAYLEMLGRGWMTPPILEEQTA